LALEEVRCLGEMQKKNDVKQEINNLKSELEDGLTQAKKLRELMKKYVELAERMGLPLDVDKAIKRIQKMRRMLSEAKERVEENKEVNKWTRRNG